MSLRRTAAATVLTAMIATTGAVTSSSAVAAPGSERAKATPGCVTKAEFAKVKKGMTIAQVKRITGTNGKQVSRQKITGYGIITGRAYKACKPRGGVGMSFVQKPGKPAKLEAKSARGL